jgi:hypothetical protein
LPAGQHLAGVAQELLKQGVLASREVDLTGRDGGAAGDPVEREAAVAQDVGDRLR